MTVVCERESLVLPFARAFSQSDACGRAARGPQLRGVRVKTGCSLRRGLCAVAERGGARTVKYKSRNGGRSIDLSSRAREAEHKVLNRNAKEK